MSDPYTDGYARGFAQGGANGFSEGYAAAVRVLEGLTDDGDLVRAVLFARGEAQQSWGKTQKPPRPFSGVVWVVWRIELTMQDTDRTGHHPCYEWRPWPAERLSEHATEDLADAARSGLPTARRIPGCRELDRRCEDTACDCASVDVRIRYEVRPESSRPKPPERIRSGSKP